MDEISSNSEFYNSVISWNYNIAFFIETQWNAMLDLSRKERSCIRGTTHLLVWLYARLKHMCANYSSLCVPRLMQLPNIPGVNCLTYAFGKDREKLTRKYCQLRNSSFFSLIVKYYFFLKFHWVLSFPNFIWFTDSKIIFWFNIFMI